MAILQNCVVSGFNLGYFFEPDKQLFKGWYISKVQETASSKLSQRMANYIPENKPHIQCVGELETFTGFLLRHLE